MKKTIVTSTLFATLLSLSPAFADDQAKAQEAKKPAAAKTEKKEKAHPPKKVKAPAEKKEQKKAPEKPAKKCLDTEIQRLEISLNNIGKAVDQRMQQQSQKLAQSQEALKKANAESEALRKRLATAELNTKNMTAEFNAFKASVEKQRQATMAAIEKHQQAAKTQSQELAGLKKQNAHLEAHCKAACDRLKGIVDNLQKVEKELTGAKK